MSGVIHTVLVFPSLVESSRVILKGEQPDYIHAVLANVCFLGYIFFYNNVFYNFALNTMSCRFKCSQDMLHNLILSYTCCTKRALSL